jgi:hypothetical protein|tara:strand:+ start:9 stop:428 length:420 start_codon:yes stop_codon:yes gene_type:complete
MSNERIDLTQFEGKGISPLMVIPGTYTIAEDNNRIYEDEGYNYPEDDKNRYGWIVGHIDSHYETDDPEYGIVQSERQEAMAKLFAMAPDLIAELKRSYEELDEYDKLVGLLIENHFVETSPYETVKHLIETHQDYKASE